MGSWQPDRQMRQSGCSRQAGIPVVHSGMHQEALGSSTVLATALEGASQCCRYGLEPDSQQWFSPQMQGHLAARLATVCMRSSAPDADRPHLAQICILTYNESILSPQL